MRHPVKMKDLSSSLGVGAKEKQMTKLEELREFQKELEADPGFVDVKFSAGDWEVCKNATLEEIAADALVLLKGSEKGVDISDEIL